MSDLQILEEMERFLPQNQQTKQYSLAKKLEKDMMHTDRRLFIDFANDFNNETITLIGRFTSWQIRFEKINRDEPMIDKEEVILLQDFSKAIVIKGMPKEKCDIIRKEIKKKIANCTNFLIMLEIIQQILL